VSEGELEKKLSKQEKEFNRKLKTLKAKVNQFIKHPNGTKDFPARTCNDLFAYDNTIKSGYYWIDPNQGCKEDAIRVFCNFTMVNEEPVITTCVEPKKTPSIEKHTWTRKMYSVSSDKYFDEDHDLGKLEYNSDMTQMKYLGLLSKDAYQNVTVHCKKTIAWMNSATGGYDRAMKFKGMNDQVFAKSRTDDDSRYAPEVMKDECAYGSLEWKETVLRFTSHKFIRLPITDFATMKSADSTSEFGITLGPVCFL